MTENSHISASWKKFLLQKLPVTLIFMALAAELLALAADGISYRRHDLDLLALNVELSSASTPQTVVLGDSVTQDIFKTYAIGAKGDVANLTTNKASGLVGAYLLLQRYLQSHTAPHHLLIASTPELLTFQPSGETARVYLKTVFTKPDESAFLTSYLQDVEPSFAPAILHMDQRLGLKAQALVAPSPTGLLMGDKAPDASRTPRERKLPLSIQDAIVARGRNSLDIPEANATVIRNICALAQKHDFTIHFLTAPIPKTTHKAWTDNGVLSRYTARLTAALENDCPATFINDGTPLIVSDAAMRDSDHLVRHDWTNVYAVQLDGVVRGLPTYDPNQ